jgi:hypothetical protein
MITVIQGPISFNRCATQDHVCVHQHSCRICGKLRLLQGYVDQALAGITLDELARDSVATDGSESHGSGSGDVISSPSGGYDGDTHPLTGSHNTINSI